MAENTTNNVEKTAAFIEETAKKVQDRQANSNFNKFDFGYSSPSSKIGENNNSSLVENQVKGLQAQGLDVTRATRYQNQISDKDNTVVYYNQNGKEHKALFDNNQNSSSYSAIVSQKSTDNVNVGGKARSPRAPRITGSNQIENGRVNLSGKRDIRATTNRTDIKASVNQNIPTKNVVVSNSRGGASGSVGSNNYNPSKKFGINHDGTNPANVNASNDANVASAGSYNTGRHDMTGIANSVIQSVKQQYDESETRQGYHESKHRGSLYGIGTTKRAVTKYSIESSLYGRGDAVRLNTLFNPYGGKGFSYRVGTSRSGNIVQDYQSNLRAVERYLESQHINAKNLNRVEIKLALQKGDLKHIYHLGENIPIQKGSDIEFALKELLFLRKEGDNIKKFQQASGGIKNTAKAWIREASQGSDVATGYNTYRTSKAVVKGTGAVGTVLTKGVLKTGVSGVTAITNAPDKMIKAYSKIRIHSTTNPIKKAKYSAINTRSSNRINVRRTRATNAKVKINRFNPIGNAKLSLKNAVINKRESLRMVKRFRKLQERMRNSAIGKFFGGIFAKINAFTAALKWALIGAAIVFVIAFFVDVALIWITSFIGAGSSATVENSADRDASQTMAQKTIDYLYAFQEAYTENIHNCKVSNLNKDGSLMIEKRLPASWFTQMSAADNWINDNHAAVDYNGSQAGYDMAKYWGQYADKSGAPSGMDSVGNKPLYTVTVMLATNEYQTITGVHGDGSTYSYEERIYKPVKITICGNAGLGGYTGTYQGNYYESSGEELKYNYYKTKNGMRIDNVDGAIEALNEWANKENTDVKVSYYYRGSQYSCHLTRTKYSAYFNTNGTKIFYDVDEFYKAFLTMAMGITDNNDSDMEDHEFYKKYSKELFDQVMEDAKVSLSYKYLPDPTQRVKFNFTDTLTGDTHYDLETGGYRCEVTLKVALMNCGVADMMEEDAKIHNGDAGNEWMHNNVDRSLANSDNKFKENNPGSPNYVTWLTTKHEDNYLNTDSNWLMPVWGKEKDEPWNDIKTHYDSGNPYHHELEHKYTRVMANTIEFDNFTLEDWHAIIDGIKFPSEINIADLIDEQTWEAIQSLDGILNEDIDWENVDWSTFTTGDIDIDNFLQLALLQSDISKKADGIGGLCCFTSYMMVTMYLHPERAMEIKSNLGNLAKQYCGSNGTFYRGDFGKVYGISSTDDIVYSANTLKQKVSEQLDAGKPMILHFTKNIYEPDGTKVYGFTGGSGTHFMVVYSCNDREVTVCDPGTAGKRTMSWDAFYAAQSSGGLRTVSAN